MSIAEKLTTIAENIQKVYEAGKSAGGSTDDILWDYIQDYGNRTDYNTGVFQKWAWEYADPKYKITLNNTSYSNFRFGSATLKNINPDKFDFSNTVKLNYTFADCPALEEIPIILGSSQFYQTCAGCTNLKRVKGLKFINLANYDQTETFKNCTSLESIDEIIGEFGGRNFNVQWCPLNHATLLRILNSLADKSADTSGTSWSITLGTNNLAKLTDAEKAIATGKGWTLA